MKRSLSTVAALLVFLAFLPHIALAEKPVVTARFTDQKIELDGCLDENVWNTATPVEIQRTLDKGEAVPALSTTVRVLWTADDLYISYSAPFATLTVFDPAIFEGKRVGLWKRDVVEVFINSDPEKNLNRYSEYQVAPTGEKIDLLLDLPHKDFLWESGFETAVHVDKQAKLWTTEIRIPLTAFGKEKPKPGDRWRINFYRFSTSENRFLAWNPTGRFNAHIPEKFGVLVFGSDSP